MKEEVTDRTIWRAGFGRGFGPVVRQTAKRMSIIFSRAHGVEPTKQLSKAKFPTLTSREIWKEHKRW